MTEILSTFAPAAVSITGAVVSAYYGHRLGRKARVEDDDRLALRFREPLLQAAFNLQSRLYNIARLDFLGNFLTAGAATEHEREYAVQNSVYLVGQYLGWVEVIRRESQYMDPRSRARNRQIVAALEQVRATFADSRQLTDPTLRVFRGEQRAIGEVMLVATAVGAQAPRWECKGYAQYIQDRDAPPVHRWFGQLEEDLALLGKEPEAHLDRLKALQRDLLALIDVLDPEGERVPLAHRERI